MNRGKARVREGVVVSDKMDKTVVVAVDRLVRHPRYKKYVRRRAHYKAHDESNRCAVGDRVVISETRPLSKDKRWRIVQVLEKAEVVAVQPEEVDATLLQELQAKLSTPMDEEGGEPER